MTSSIESSLKEEALTLGFTTIGICGVACPPHYGAYNAWLEKGRHGDMAYLSRHSSLKANPGSLLAGARSIIAVSLNYNQPVGNDPSYPRIARYAIGRDYHRVLRNKLAKLGKWLQQTVPGCNTRACVDSAPIMERDFAQLAGLGWFGKNTCLIDSRRGSWFFVGLLLTTAELDADEPAVGSCGTCSACIEACPTGAIIFDDSRWQIDARKCISYLTIEHRGEIGHDLAGWTFGCDICQEVCPFNTPRPSQPLRAQNTSEVDFLKRRRWPTLVQLAQVSESEWDNLTKGSAVRRAGWQQLRRNARKNLNLP